LRCRHEENALLCVHTQLLLMLLQLMSLEMTTMTQSLVLIHRIRLLLERYRQKKFAWYD